MITVLRLTLDSQFICPGDTSCATRADLTMVNMACIQTSSHVHLNSWAPDLNLLAKIVIWIPPSPLSQQLIRRLRICRSCDPTWNMERAAKERQRKASWGLVKAWQVQLGKWTDRSQPRRYLLYPTFKTS
jgi:hypothetical protein